MRALMVFAVVMAVANAAVGDMRSAAALAGWAVILFFARWVISATGWRWAGDRQRPAGPGSDCDPAHSAAHAQGPERSEDQPRERVNLTNTDGIRAMRLRLRRLGRDDGMYSDDDIHGLIGAVDHLLKYGELSRLAVGDRLDCEITWRGATAPERRGPMRPQGDRR